MPSLITQFITLSCGAIVGASLRYSISLWLAPRYSHFPIATLAANWLGAFVIGILFAYSQHNTNPLFRLTLITGLLGSLTTFSTFSLETLLLLQNDRIFAALGNILLNLIGALLLSYLGMKLAS